jgi:PAS domain S-box-containing protein
VFFSYTNYRNSLKAAHLARLNDLATLKQKIIEMYCWRLKSHIRTAQSFYNIKKNLPILVRLARKSGSPEFLSAKRMLDSQLQEIQLVQGLTDIMLVNPEGQVIYSSNIKHQATEFLKPLPDPEQKAFHEGIKKVSFVDFYSSEDDENSFSLLVTAPLYDFDNVFIGVIAFEVPMAPIYELTRDVTGLGDTGETLLGKRVGNEVVFVSPPRHNAGTFIKKRTLLGDKTTIGMQKATQGMNGSGAFIDYRGEPVIGAWRYVPSLDWGLVSKIDIKEAYVDLYKLRNLMIVVLIIILILSGVMALSIAKSISKPIKKLSEGAEIIGSGNLDYKVGTGARDEIGQLSRSFDKMTQDLKGVTASRDELDKEISERKKVEKALYLTQFSVDHAAEVIFLIRPDAYFHYVNEEACRLLGYTQKEFLSLAVYDIDPNFRKEVWPKHWENIKKYSSLSFETVHRKKDGRTIPVEVVVNYIKSGDLEYNCAWVRDISERQRSEKALKKAHDELELRVVERTAELIKTQKELDQKRRLSDIGVLAATVAHELRNPLAAIHLAAANIKKKAANPLLEKHIATIEKKVTESDQIISNLLFYSRIKPPDLKETDINEIIEECATLAYHQYKKDTASMDIQTEALKEVLIKVDPLQIKEVFSNLINNAFDALSEKGGRIEVKARTEENFLHITIKDTGVGISESDLDSIFDPFFTTKAKGTGLGLTVSKQIIQLHNGSINITSQIGEGTSVLIKLPI